jgi:hypothetical protein
MILGGVAGGVIGQKASSAAAARHGLLTYVFAALVIGVGAYLAWTGI